MVGNTPLEGGILVRIQVPEQFIVRQLAKFKNMKIKFLKEDFYKCFEFPVKYYLDDKKSKSNRTTGQQRGLGSVINDFFLGKLIEIGVARVIEENSNGKKCELDFSIHATGEDHDNDPDILKIVDKDGIRSPNIFVEIKNVS